ncbi:MAG: hypothetical protein MJZ72_06390 [Bacteroidales bacterium]|nr:hypothetical protein [Bacteroidales bacterium]
MKIKHWIFLQNQSYNITKMAITTDVRGKLSSDVPLLKQNWLYFNGYPRPFNVMEQGEDERGKFYKVYYRQEM